MNTEDDDKVLAKLLDEQLPEGLATKSMDKATEQRLYARIARRANASEPEGTRTVRNGSTPWLPFLPGIKRKILLPDDGNGFETALFRMRPGAVLPKHQHTQTEECWVVEGEIRVGDFSVHEGDVHVAYPGCEHDAIVAPGGALLLIKSESYPSFVPTTNS